MSNADYLKRKKDELGLLNGNIDDSNSFNDLESISEILNKKLLCQSKLKKEFIDFVYNIQNTSRNSQNINYNGLECKYEYQRYDIDLKIKDFLKKFYNLNINSCKYFFTNCGMSSITGVFYALNKLNYKIEYKENIYVETERFLNDYLQLNKTEYDKKALLLDSVNFKKLDKVIDKYDLNEYGLFIVDTTLYLRDDNIKIISMLEKYNKPIILIKSHTKLDMLGIEWSKLGSIVIYSTDEKIRSLLTNQIKIILSFIGGFAYLEDIPLYMSNDKYIDISNVRNMKIKENTQYVYEILKQNENHFTVFKPDHDMFVLITPDRYIDYKKLENDLHTYSENSEYKNYICYSDSFGLDWFGINGYYINMSVDTEVIRISPSDYSKELCSKIINDFITWINNYLKEE